MSLALCVLYIKELLKVLSSLTKVRKKHSHFKKILIFLTILIFLILYTHQKKEVVLMKKNLLKKASVYFINFLVVLMIVVLPVATVQAASQIETPIETRSKQNSNLEGGRQRLALRP